MRKSTPEEAVAQRVLGQAGESSSAPRGLLGRVQQWFSDIKRSSQEKKAQEALQKEVEDLSVTTPGLFEQKKPRTISAWMKSPDGVKMWLKRLTQGELEALGTKLTEIDGKVQKTHPSSFLVKDLILAVKERKEEVKKEISRYEDAFAKFKGDLEKFKQQPIKNKHFIVEPDVYPGFERKLEALKENIQALHSSWEQTNQFYRDLETIGEEISSLRRLEGPLKEPTFSDWKKQGY
jgi:hypothetical protein